VGTPSFILYDPRSDRVLIQLFGVYEPEEFARILRGACGEAGIKRC